MRDGTHQQERLPAALTPGYFQVDELSFEQRVAMTAGLAARLGFQDLQQRPAGHWGELFNADEALIMARILSIDLAALEAQFLKEFATVPLAHLARDVVRLAGWLDLWFKSLQASSQPNNVARAVREQIEQLVEQQLGEELRWILERVVTQLPQHDALGSELARQCRRLDAMWLRRQPARSPESQRTERELLRSAFFAFLGAIETVRELARVQLPAALRSQSHQPAAGLLLAFLKLYERAQQQVNRFTERHAQFYYHEVLRMQPRPAVPDNVHLVALRDTRSRREVVIPRGAVFAAGKDAQGVAIEFRADEELWVGEARVAALRTLRLERDPLISPEREFAYVTRAKADQPSVAAADTARLYWPLFGGSETAQRVPRNQDACLGLAIATPLLWLQEGEREIRITLRLARTADSDATVLMLIEQLARDASIAGRLLPQIFLRYLQLDSTLLTEAQRQDLTTTAAVLARATLDRIERSGQPLVATACYQWLLFELVLQAVAASSFFARLGRFFSCWLWEEHGPDATQLQAIKQAAQPWLLDRDASAAGVGDPSSLLLGTQLPERAVVFDQLCSGLFALQLSAETGWHAATNTCVLRPQPVADRASGLQFVVRLRPEEPAIIGCSAELHGAQWPVGLPLVRLELRTQARLYPYSLFEAALLSEVDLDVSVRGARRLLLYNNLGRLDPAKPFHPFGPLPTLGSYLVVGSAEAARKHLHELCWHVEWAGLPSGLEGFAEHYQGYDFAVDNAAFGATVSILRDGQWQSAEDAAGQPLFHDQPGSHRVSRHSCIKVPPAALSKHATAGGGEPFENGPFEYGLDTRHGFFKLQLTDPPQAFGHQAYPRVLTQAVADGARLKRAAVLPNPPYAPLVERLALDYRASSTIRLAQGQRADVPSAERILHLHPFGNEVIYPPPPGAVAEAQPLLPRYAYDGNLFIGLSAGPVGDAASSQQQLHGTLSLLFHLCDAAASAPPQRKPRFEWAYLANNHWYPIRPADILSDSTAGFLTSGIVTLELPSELGRGNSVLPAELFWLRLAVNEGFEAFAGLYGIHAQAVRATRVVTTSCAQPLAASTIKQSNTSIPGLVAVTQVGESFGLRRADDPQQLRVRSGERLQHKQRACTPWDYERLVLERFTSVFKVKCFTQAELPPRLARDAQVLVVVVPAGGAAEPADETLVRRLNAIELERISVFLRELAPPFARIQVRNAAYEYIQVRCSVKLAGGAADGRALRRINQTIIDHLSPWQGVGYPARFDWTVRGEDIEAWIRALDCVEFVTKLSLLHVATDEQRLYSFADTARMAVPVGAHLRPKSPWSIAIPMREHIITSVHAYADAAPEITGIAKLAIGSTFILGGTP